MIGLKLITVIWKLECGERIDRFTADYCDMEMKVVNELIGLQLITVIRKPEGGERIDRFTADYCDMET